MRDPRLKHFINLEVLNNVFRSFKYVPSIAPYLLRISPHFQERQDFYASRLFEDVQLARIFLDSKTFADAEGKSSFYDIEKEYWNIRKQEGFNLTTFVYSNFRIPTINQDPTDGQQSKEGGKVDERDYVKLNDEPDTPILEYIDLMWKNLTRRMDKDPKKLGRSSLIPLPNPAIVPGGRFREAYYWDTAWPVMWLLQSEKESDRKLATGVINNFKHLTETYGFIPNGNRDYYMGRSQPPLLFLMVNALIQTNPDQSLEYLTTLRASHNFWTRPMLGTGDAEFTSPLQQGRAVRAPKEAKSNIAIYDSATGLRPRIEGLVEDVAAYIANLDGNYQPQNKKLFRDIQASCESGWDFSQRFSQDSCDPTRCLITTQIAPIELQVYLIEEARTLATLYKLKGDVQRSREYLAEAKRRIIDFNELFWDDEQGVYNDIYVRDGTARKGITAASFVPLAFEGLVPKGRGRECLDTLVTELLKPYGIVTTASSSGNQWESPYAWPPLQWFAARAAHIQGDPETAQEIMTRFLSAAENNYRRYGKIFEKYDAMTGDIGGSGEYQVQTGFAMTNAIIAIFKKQLDQDR